MVLNYLLRKTKRLVLFTFASFLLWGFLSTFLQSDSTSSISTSSTFTLNNIPTSLTNKKIQVLIAHPDDEVMFFAPSIIELNKPKYQNQISLTCLSVGNDQGLGQIRHEELVASLRILGVSDYEIINDESKFKDSMEIEWDSATVAEYVSKDTDVVLTFDEYGISNHPNHKSLYHGAIASGKSVFALKSWKINEKYSSTLATNIQIVLRLLDFFVSVFINKVKPYGIESYVPTTLLQKLHQKLHENVHIFADLPSTILGVAAMSNAHSSQMVWFRWGWLAVSKYGNSNELIQVQ